MKKLIVSIRSSSESLAGFKKALKAARKGRLTSDHNEVSFDNTKDFDQFVRHLRILSAILAHKPKSVHALSKIVDMKVSDLNKLIVFFETAGAITIKTSTVAGRKVKTPLVDYQQIEFDLKAAV